jgi:hypothetical protein
MTERQDAYLSLLSRITPCPPPRLTVPGDPARWQTYQDLPLRYTVIARAERAGHL